MNFKQTIVSALGWSIGIKLVFQLVTWAMTLVVIRKLSPDDYGLMAESQIFVNILIGFGLLGFGDALVQQKDTPEVVVGRVFSVVLLTSVGLTALMALEAHSIADWYHDARLAPLIQVYSLGFLFNGLIVLPQAYLTKHLRVQSLLIIELSSGLFGGAVVIVMAYGGYGVWALMLGWLTTNVVKLLGFIVLCSDIYVWPRLGVGGLRPLFVFGIFRTFEIMLWITYTSADVLIISRWLGSTALGVYAVAMNFVTLPVSRFAPIVNSIAFPAFALVQGRPIEARFYALKSLRLMAVMAVPVFFAMCATAPEVVDVLFGPKWAATTPVLSVLSLAITFRAILIMFPNYLLGIGDSRAGFWCTAAGAAIFPPAFVIGCQWGIEGVAYAWLIGYPVVFAINALIASRRGGLDFGSVIFAPFGPIVAGAIMVAVITAVRFALPEWFPRIGDFAILLSVGIVTYCGVILLLFRKLALEMFQLVSR